MKRALISILLCACQASFDPPTYLHSLRILAIGADPPEIGAGQSTTLTPLLYVPPNTVAPSLHWRACPLGVVPGSDQDINSNCLADDQSHAANFIELGTQPTAIFTMPTLNPASLGLPDFTGGIYLPIRLDIDNGITQIRSFYRLRYQLSSPPNHNPHLIGIFNSGTVPIDPNQPLPIPLQQLITPGITLFAQLQTNDDEVYIVPGNPPRSVTELPSFAWYSSAGEFSEQVTGQARPNTILKFDKFTAVKGATVDIYVVAEEERGGTDFAHVTLTVN